MLCNLSPVCHHPSNGQFHPSRTASETHRADLTCVTLRKVTAVSKSKHAPTTIQAREREAEAVRLRAVGHSFDDIGRRLGVARQSAWRIVDRAMDRAATDLSASVGRLRMMEAAKLDAAAESIFPAVLGGDLNAHRTWLMNRGRHASLLALDMQAPTGNASSDVQVTINTAPPWNRPGPQRVGSVVPYDDVLMLPDPDALPEPPFA